MDQSIPKNALSFILLTAFLNMMGIGIIIPVIPFLVGQYIPGGNGNAIAFSVGLLTSLYSLCQFLAAPGLGMLSDRFGRRPILLISLLGSAVGYFLLGIGGSLWMLYLGRIIDGLTGGNISTIFAYIADLTQPKDRAKYYGLIGGAMGFGFLIGPALGGLVSTISLSAPLYLAALITLINIVWGYGSLPESLTHEHRLEKFEWNHLNPFGHFEKVLSHKELRQLLFISFLYYLPFAALQGNMNVLLKDTLHWNPINIGFLFLIIGGIDIVTQGFLIRKFLTWFKEIKLVIVGFICVTAGFICNTLVPFFPLPVITILGTAVFAFGGGLAEPALSGLISHTVDAREQGRVQGANQSMQSLARVIGPIVAALLYQIRWSLPYAICVFLTSWAIIEAIRFLKSHPAQQQIHH